VIANLYVFWLLHGGSCPSEVDTQADGKFLSFFVCSGKFLGDGKFFICKGCFMAAIAHQKLLSKQKAISFHFLSFLVSS